MLAAILILSVQLNRGEACRAFCLERGAIGGRYLRDDPEQTQIVCACEKETRVTIKASPKLPFTPEPGPVPTHDARDYMPPWMPPEEDWIR